MNVLNGSEETKFMVSLGMVLTYMYFLRNIPASPPDGCNQNKLVYN